MTNAHTTDARTILAARAIVASKQRERRFWDAAQFLLSSAFLMTVALTMLSWSLSH
jgi:hypothetical protein